MRIDIALKYLCLAKSRSSVKAMCDREAITINANPAKASSTLHIGDRISMQFATRALTIKLSEIPERQLSKKKATTYYEVIEDY